MVLLEITAGWSLLTNWFLAVVLAWVFVVTLSSCAFYRLFWKPTFKLWQQKSNPSYPSPDKVREEIFQMHKGLVFAAFAPALTLWLTHKGLTRGYSGIPHSWVVELGAQLAYWLILDFVEFLYHYTTHVSPFFWRFHKYHHTFPNPSPFAVIADEVVDQVVRASPMVIIPLFLPLNLDILFFQMAFIHYGYGTYLHCGHELNYPDAHHSFVNTSYHHYCHHAVSIIRKPYHCGFIFSVFDRIAGSVYWGTCLCAKCCRARGERTEDQWGKVKIQDYSVMLTWGFWKEGIALELEKMRKGTWIRIT